LISLSFFSYRGENIVGVSDYPAVYFWGNTADMIVEDGTGEISINSSIGTAWLFRAPSGNVFSWCWGECQVRVMVPKKIPVNIRLLDGSVFVSDREKVTIDVDSGVITTQNVASTRISLFRGVVEGAVPLQGQFSLIGHHIDAEIYSPKEWSYEVIHKGKSFLSDVEKPSDSFAKVEYFEGNIELISQGISKQF